MGVVLSTSNHMDVMSVTLKNSRFEKTAQNSFRHLYGDLALSDVTLVSKDEELFSVHRMVLATASNKLKKLLETNKPSHLLHLDQMSEDIKLILKFIYTGTVDHSNLPKVIKMVNALGMDVPQFEVEEATSDLKTEDAHNGGLEEEQEERTVEEPSSKEYEETSCSMKQELEEKPDSSLSESNQMLIDDYSSKMGQEEEEEQQKVFPTQVSENSKSEETDFRHTVEYEPSYKCDKCDYSSNRSSQVKRHRLIHTKKLWPKNPHRCAECDFSSSSWKNMQKHKTSSKHSIKEELVLKCDQCDYTSAREYRISAHKLTHVTFNCDKCDYKGKVQDKLILHQNTTHTDGNLDASLACFACENEFVSKQDLLEHTQSEHMRPRVFCEQCDKSYALKSSLAEHKQIVHEGVKFYCDECPLTFTRMDYLNLHKKTILHGGEKSFKCSHCEASYTARQNLAIHLSSKHIVGTSQIWKIRSSKKGKK